MFLYEETWGVMGQVVRGGGLISSWKAITTAELRDDEDLNYGKGCGSGVDVGLGEWVRMVQISSPRGMKESLVTITSSDLGTWRMGLYLLCWGPRRGWRQCGGEK